MNENEITLPGPKEIIPEPSKNLEKNKNRFADALKSAIEAIQDQKTRKLVERLFHEGSLLFETHSFINQTGEIEGLTVATDGASTYFIRFSGKESSIVTMTIHDLQGNETAHLTLSQFTTFRPEIWNRWQGKQRQDITAMTEIDRQKVLQQFATNAHLDQAQTRKRAVEELWKALKEHSDLDLGKTFGDLQVMGKGWGDFVDGKHNLLHPLPPPRDVVYDHTLPTEPENLLDEPGGGDWKSRVEKSFFKEWRELLNIATLLEGITGHQIIFFNDRPSFGMLPTKRGIEIFEKLKATIPVMLSSLSKEELTLIFEGISNDSPTWDFVMPHLREGIGEGFFQEMGYIAEAETTTSTDETDQEFLARANHSRRFRFLAQAHAQKVRAGIVWKWARKNSVALQELAKLEELSVDEVVKKYAL